jgi:hypothetical protein
MEIVGGVIIRDNSVCSDLQAKARVGRANIARIRKNWGGANCDGRGHVPRSVTFCFMSNLEFEFRAQRL